MFHVERIKNQNGRSNRNKRLKNIMKIYQHLSNYSKFSLELIDDSQFIELIDPLTNEVVKSSLSIVTKITTQTIHFTNYLHPGIELKGQISLKEFRIIE